MNYCLILKFFSKIESGDFLTYSALALAFMVYTWSVGRDYNSWKSLFISFKTDLKTYEEWLGSEYFSEKYNDKTSFHPFKIIFPLSFESLPEIIRRGASEFSWISDIFINQLSLFNERVISFNSLLDHMKRVVSANPVITEKLIDKLNDLGVEKEEVTFGDFKKKIYDSKKGDEIFYLAENIRRLNRTIHVKCIGNKNDKDKLHYLYTEINKELDSILTNFEKKRPFFIKYRWYLVLFSVVIFVFVEIIMK